MTAYTPKIAAKKVLLTGQETTYGVDPGLVAANAMLVSNFSMKPQALTVEKRQLAFPNYGATVDAMTQMHRTMTYDVEAAGSGAAGTAPIYDELLQMCGMSSTVSAGASVTYTPLSTGQVSAAAYFFWDGLKHTLLGGRGSWKLTLQGGKLPQWNFEHTGLFAAATDTAAPAGVAAQIAATQLGVEVNNANTTFTIGGIAVTLEKLEINLGNTVVFRDRPNAPYVAITNRKVMGSITFEATTVATEDWMTAVVNNTQLAISLTHGTVAGNKIHVAAGKVQLGEPTYTDLQGVLGVTFPLIMVRTNGDDEISVVIQ